MGGPGGDDGMFSGCASSSFPPSIFAPRIDSLILQFKGAVFRQLKWKITKWIGNLTRILQTATKRGINEKFICGMHAFRSNLPLTLSLSMSYRTIFYRRKFRVGVCDSDS